VAIGAGLYVAMAIAFPTHTHRYRLTIEIDTPAGVRSGSSVIEVKRKDFRWLPLVQGRYEFHLRGEAVFVDLSANRSVIALLAHGARAENVDQMISLPIEAYGHDKWSEDAWAGRAKMQGAVELKPPLVPTLVTFANLSDPKTAQVVYATDVRETSDGRTGRRREMRVAINRFGELFGPGYRFKRALIETTNAPATPAIGSRLPWWGAPGRPAYQAHLAMKGGDATGPSSAAEYLFERK